MATVQGVVTEIEEAVAIIKRTENVVLHNGLVTSICGKIKTIKNFGAGQASSLYDAVDGFDPAMRELLVAAIDARLGGGFSARGASFTS